MFTRWHQLTNRIWRLLYRISIWQSTNVRTTNWTTDCMFLTPCWGWNKMWNEHFLIWNKFHWNIFLWVMVMAWCQKMRYQPNKRKNYISRHWTFWPLNFLWKNVYLNNTRSRWNWKALFLRRSNMSSRPRWIQLICANICSSITLVSSESLVWQD